MRQRGVSDTGVERCNAILERAVPRGKGIALDVTFLLADAPCSLIVMKSPRRATRALFGTGKRADA